MMVSKKAGVSPDEKTDGDRDVQKTEKEMQTLNTKKKLQKYHFKLKCDLIESEGESALH